MLCIIQQREPKDVLPVLVNTKTYEVFACGNWYAVKATSKRYQVFSVSTCCAICGIEGTVLRLELFDNPDARYKAHYNLYAIRHGVYILITKDHIKPKSKGGSDHISNLQTMCQPCNARKKDIYHVLSAS